jgi:hypothetical protein
VRRGIREGTSVDLADALTVPFNAMPRCNCAPKPPSASWRRSASGDFAGRNLKAWLRGSPRSKVPVGTVRWRLSRGRDQLRRLMGMDEKPGENEHSRAAWLTR